MYTVKNVFETPGFDTQPAAVTKIDVTTFNDPSDVPDGGVYVSNGSIPEGQTIVFAKYLVHNGKIWLCVSSSWSTLFSPSRWIQYDPRELVTPSGDAWQLDEADFIAQDKTTFIQAVVNNVADTATSLIPDTIKDKLKDVSKIALTVGIGAALCAVIYIISRFKKKK